MNILILFSLFLLEISLSNGNDIALNDNDWKNSFDGEWMLLLYAPWCPACKSIKHIWKDFAVESKINVGSIDITENPIAAGSFAVSKLPTIYHIKNGAFRQFNGARTVKGFLEFHESGYKSVEPVPWYTNPSAIHMRILGYLFKASQIILQWQKYMESEYNWPVWATYVVIGVSIMVFGILLSLILVFICDMLMPPRPQVRKYFSKPDKPNPYISKETDGDKDTFPENSDVAKVQRGVFDMKLDDNDSAGCCVHGGGSGDNKNDDDNELQIDEDKKNL